jgi:hypothetical protein
MKITINPVLDIETLQWVSNDGVYEYDGPTIRFDGGASGAAKENETAQSDFYNAMTSEQATTFGEAQDILNNQQTAWNPVLAAGPYQFGFSTAEDDALKADITNEGATATTNTENAALLREQQASGGANAGPSGATEAINAQVAAEGAQSTAASLSKEKLAGYEQGSNLFSEASNALSNTAQLENPVGTAGATTGAGQGSTSAINLVDTENANSLVNKVIGGVAGGISNIPMAFAG